MPCQQVGFVAITNRPLDAAKSNRAVQVFRPPPAAGDLIVLARGCLQVEEGSVSRDQDRVLTGFCEAYRELLESYAPFKRMFQLRDLYHAVRYSLLSHNG